MIQIICRSIFSNKFPKLRIDQLKIRETTWQKKNYQYSHGIGEQLGLNSLFSYNRIFFHSCTSDNYVIFLGLEFSIDISETKKFSSNIKHGLPLGTIFVKLINVEDYFFVIFLILKFRDFLIPCNVFWVFLREEH